MRILLANKFYYRRGGDCVYVINLEQLLKKHGHQVAVFAMDFPENLPSDYSKYFPSEVKFKPGLGMFETLIRPFGSSETKKKFKKLLDDFKPDIVHLNNIHTQLSPILAEIAHARGVKVVWTLHDYKLLCPRYDCLKNGEAICEECFENKHKVLDHKCMKNSGVASLLAYKEAVAWHRERLEKCTDAFICPSEFMASKMAQGGFNKNRLIHLCNFIDVEKCKRDDDFAKDDYYCFIGRLSHEKGARTLIEAANQLPERKLVVIGGGPLESELRQIAGSHIEFVGFKQWDEIKTLVGRAKFVVVPSEWYENNPLSVIEALCLGTPVLGANVGGIPELIQEGISGRMFESRNAGNLKEKINEMFNTSFNYREIALVSQSAYSADHYYQNLLPIYTD